MLDRCKGIEPVLLILREPVVLQTSCIYAVLGLLCNHGLMWRQVKVVSSTAEFLEMVVLGRDLGIKSGLYVSSEADCLT